MTQQLSADASSLWNISDEERLRIACRAASIGVWQWDLITNEMQYTDVARSICGFSAKGPITYEMVRDVTHPDDFGRTSALAKRALDPDLREIIEFRYRIIRADTGEVRWVEAYGEAKFALHDGTERAILYIGSIKDITDEHCRELALAESEARLRLAVDVGRMAVWEVDVDSDTVIASPELNRLCGFPEGSTPTLPELRSRYAPGEQDRITKESQEILSRGENKLQFEIKHIWPDGTEKLLLMRAEVGMNRAGTGMRVIGVLVDLTEEKKQEERLATVARELRHRLLNTISIVGALASRSWPKGFDETKNDFQERLRAIGTATNLMFLHDKDIGTATLKHLLYQITEPYRRPDHDPFVFNGPDVDIQRHMRPLAMAFHELCTNAIKYGALSTTAGHVEVCWMLNDDGSLEIVWQEANGPTVETPTRVGLGSTLLNKLLFSPPNSISMEYFSSGVCCSIRIHD